MTDQKNQQKSRKRIFPAVLMALFLAFCLSSGMLGFLLGRNAARSAGEVVDTIVLSPGDSSLRTQATLHYLSGRVLTPVGEPVEGATVRLGDGERSDVTDEAGKFYLSDIRPGQQTLEVTGERGELLASREISLDFSAEAAVSADPSGTPASFTMPENTRMLELTLTVAEDKTLQVHEKEACFVTKQGQVVNFNGEALQVEESSHAVTPTGNLVDSRGYVLMPTKAVMVTPQGGQARVESAEEALPGTVLEPGGTVEIGTVAVLLPSGTIQEPDGETVGGNGKVVLIGEASVQELEKLPEVYVPAPPTEDLHVPEEESRPEKEESSAASSSSEPAPRPSAEASPTAGPTAAPPAALGPEDGFGEAESSSTLESQEPQNAPSPEETPTPEPTADGFQVIDAETQLAWRQQSFIDLFKNRTGLSAVKTHSTSHGGAGNLPGLDGESQEEIPVAAPGDQGYYRFQLKNAEEFEIVYTVTVTEKSFHLPILYSVIDEDSGYHYLHRERTGDSSPVSSKEIRIKPGTVQNFRIEWEWQYEDWFRPSIDDALDTAAATREDRTYLVTVSIDAEQSPYTNAGDYGDDMRYPGKR